MKKPLYKGIGIRVIRGALLLTVAGLSMVGSSAFAEDTPDFAPARLQQLFLEAGQAYDAGRPLDAAKIYRDLLSRGYASRELLYNLGNACYKAGQLGEAVLNYRRAWYLAPRDPDIRANLNFAFQSAGAPVPEPSLPVVFLTKLSFSEWLATAVIGWWLIGGLIVAYLFLPAWRAIWRRGLLVVGLVTILSILGLLVWGDFYRHPEVVVVSSGQKAYSGPVAESVALFSLPAGTLARRKGTRDTWTELSLNKQTGWMPSAHCAVVADLNSLRHGTYP